MNDVWKKNISITLHSDIISRVDAYAEKYERGNRSACIEKILIEKMEKVNA